jgi:hypothetical protein
MEKMKIGHFNLRDMSKEIAIEFLEPDQIEDFLLELIRITLETYSSSPDNKGMVNTALGEMLGSKIEEYAFTKVKFTPK